MRSFDALTAVRAAASFSGAACASLRPTKTARTKKTTV